VFELLGASVDALHALAMLIWGVGLPLLFWHRWRKLTRIYMAYSLIFIAVSVISHFALGGCFLTVLSRELYLAGDHPELRERTMFIVRAVEFVAGIRPSERWAVWVWQAGLFLGSAATLWSLHRDRTRPRVSTSVSRAT
jgi:hypothetical protein